MHRLVTRSARSIVSPGFKLGNSRLGARPVSFFGRFQSSSATKEASEAAEKAQEGAPASKEEVSNAGTKTEKVPNQPSTIELKEKEIAKLQEEISALERQLLLSYADGENARREQQEALKKADKRRISAFISSVSEFRDTLHDTAVEVEKAAEQSRKKEGEYADKLKAVAEGLAMTRDIMEKALEKHSA